MRRGLVRTFQINTLFPHLTPLEAVTLAVCEREGIAAHLVAPISDLSRRHRRGLRHPRIADARRGLLLARRASCAYGQQRLLEIALALATKPKVLLLDEPAAGVPRDESAELFTAITSLSQDITVLFIEHDMDLVFRFASRIIVMVGGRILLEGTPDEISADPRVREVYLGRAHGESAWLSRSSRFKDVRAGYGDAVVLDGISLRAARARQPRGARPQRRRQDARCCSPSWASPSCRRGSIRWRGTDITAAARRTAARAPASAGWRRSARFSHR